MIDGARPIGGRDLQPVEHRTRWIAWGLALQAIGVGIPATAALRRANKDGVLGNISHYTFRLVEHEMLRSRADIALIVLGVVLFVSGGIVLARPFVKHRSTLFVAVPAAATAGVLVLGVIALVCAAVVAVFAGDADVGSFLDGFSSWPIDGRRKRRK
jgi:hypothetical protein